MAEHPETSIATDAGAVPAPGAQSVLRNRAFMLLWVAQALSQVAQNALILGLLVIVQRLTQSPAHLSIATFALVLPSVLFSMLAGVAVDFVNKKTVLFATNVLRVVAVGAFLLLDDRLLPIYVVAFLFSTVGQFFAPAEAAAIPLLVPKEQLIAANSLFNLTLSASQLVGLVIVAPVLIKLLGISGFLAALMILFALAAACVLVLPTDQQARGSLWLLQSRKLLSGVIDQLREGWAILHRDGQASIAMLYLTLMMTLAPLLAVIGPVFAVGVIRTSAEDVVYLFAPAGVGMVLTTTVLGKIVERLGKLRLMVMSLLAMGGTLALLAAAKTGGSFLLYNVLGLVMDTRPVHLEIIPIVMLLSLALGIEFVCIAVPAQTMLQERCPPEFRGRIFGVQFTLAGAGSLLPLLGAGAFADIFGVNKTILFLGLILMGVAALTLGRLKQLAA